jgi:hypothetical protein
VLAYLSPPQSSALPSCPARQQSFAHLVRECFVVDGGLGLDAHRVQLLEDAIEAIVLCRCGASRPGIAAPENRDLVGRRAWMVSVHA